MDMKLILSYCTVLKYKATEYLTSNEANTKTTQGFQHSMKDNTTLGLYLHQWRLTFPITQPQAQPQPTKE